MAVPEDDNGVTDGHELLNVVADEEHRTVAAAHLVDEPVHHVPALPSQGGGGLVDDKELRLGALGPGHLQELALLEGHGVDHLGRVDPLHPDLVQGLGRGGVHGLQVQQPGLGELLLPSGEDIGRHADVVKGALLLDHHGHPLGDGVGDVVGSVGLAVEVKLSLILLLDAGHDGGEG